MEITDTQIQAAVSNLEDILKLLGLEGTVKGSAEDEAVKLTVASDEAGRIIGRKGRTLSAIQLLLNGMLRKEDEFDARVEVSIDGYEKPAGRRGRNGRRRNRDRSNRKDNRNGDGNSRSDKGKKSPSKPRNEPKQKSAEPPEEDPANLPDVDIFDAVPESEPAGEVVAEPQAEAQAEEPEETKPEPSTAVEPEPPAEARPTPPKDRSRSRDSRGSRDGGRSQERDSGGGVSDPQRARKQAVDAAKEVKRWGENVTLPLMSEDECRAAMQALEEDDSVAVLDDESSRGDRKRLTITLSGNS